MTALPFVPGLRASAATKLLWHSSAAERVWTPRLDAIVAAWGMAERTSVLEGLRPACQQPLSHADAIDAIAWATNRGLKTRVMAKVGAFSGFAHQYRPGDDMLVLAIGRDLRAVEGTNDADLGYPDCCQAAFHAYFPAIVDPVFQWAGGDLPVEESETQAVYLNGQGFPPNQFVTHRRERTAPAETNPMLRYWNVRLCPHIPCSPGCEGSARLGEGFRRLMGEPGEWAAELLSGPCLWDSYRGVTIAMTPHFRIVAPGDPWAHRLVVQANGSI